MEQYLPLIVMILIGVFFRSKKKKPEQEQTKPFTEQKSESRPIGKLKEMYQELQAEMQNEAKELDQQRQQAQQAQQAQQVQPVQQTNAPRSPVASQIEPVPVRGAQSRTANSRRSANEQNRRRTKVTISTIETQRPIMSNNLLPKNGDDIIKGIIFSEIIGQPISKR